MMLISRRVFACAAAALMFGAASSASAQAADPAGCSDDVPQRATRGNTEFISNSQTVRGRPGRRFLDANLLPAAAAPAG